MPRKTFANGFPLPASDLNTYLMDQAVQTYADATARTAALPTPVEGQMSYLADTNTAYVYDGSSWNAVVDAKNQGSLLPPRSNVLINGDFAINQRVFSSTTTTGTYGFDRFYLRTGGSTGTSTYSAQTFTPGDRPSGADEAANYARIVTTGLTDQTSLVGLGQNIEGVRFLAGKTVTMSFWARAASGTPKVGGQVFQGFGSGGSSAVNVDFGYVTISTTWTRYSLTATMPELTGKTIGTASFTGQRLYTAVGTSVTGPVPQIGLQNTSVDFWGIQLEVGSIATPFVTATTTYASELAVAQRYYYQFIAGTSNLALGSGWSATAADFVIKTPVTMRTSPSMSYTGTVTANESGVGTRTFTSATFGSTADSVAIYGTGTSGLTVGKPLILNGGTFLFNAEL